MKSPPAKLVLTCTGNVADKDLEERLSKIKTTLQALSQTDNESVNLSKVEPWNSVRVTFNIPPEAAARLRELAQRGDPNLHKLGILTVQVENGETISLPPPPIESQRSLFSPPPPMSSGMPQLPPGPPLVPPSPTPVVSSPIIPVSTPTPGTLVPGQGLGGSGAGSNFPMPGVSLQQLTRPSLQGLQSPGPASLFPQQGTGNIWNSIGVPQQRPLQPPASFWNQIPQFFPQVNMTQSQANQQPQGMPSGPAMPSVQQQPKSQPKKRRKRTKKANIQPPELAVAAGQPLLPLPPHLQSLPPSNTNTQDSTDNFSANKPSNLTLPPSLIDNPISPNTPPSTAVSTSSATAAPVVASSTTTPGTQFSFTDIPMSKGLVPSPQTLQQQLLQKKTDVALTSPLLVNLLQSDISAKQFPFSSSSGSKTTSTWTDTPTTGQLGPLNQDIVPSSIPGINTSSPFMLGNGIGTLTAPNSAVPNVLPFVTSQGNMPGHIPTTGQFLPPSTLLQAQSGQLSQEQLHFQLSQLSAAQLSQVQAQHAQSFPSHMPQSSMVPGLNQVPPGHMQPFQLPGGHHMPGQPFPVPMPHSQLPNARMSIRPITTQDPMSQGQNRLGGPMYMGHMPRAPMPTDRSHLPPNDPSLNQSKGQLRPMGELHPATAPFVPTSVVPDPPAVNLMDAWNIVPTSSVVKKKQEIQVNTQAKKPEELHVSDSGTSQPEPTAEKGGDIEKSDATDLPNEPAHVFDEEAALRGMTEAERDTMAVAAIIAKEAKMAADAKNGKQSQNKDEPPPKLESSPPINTAPIPATTTSLTDENTAVSLHQPVSASSAHVPSPRSVQESHLSRPSSRGGQSMLPVADRRSSNSPVRLSPPKMPENVKQRRTPPLSALRPVHHQQPHYGPIPGSSPSSMSSGIAGLQTLTSRTFSTSVQPSVKDMALTRNPEHNTLSQFLSSVTPPTEILQMAPLFRSSKQQDTPPKSSPGFPPGPTAATNEWLSLPTVDAQKPLPLLPHVGARTPVQRAEFSAATERMLGSMLDTQKPSLGNIERPPNQPRVITTEGINFMHKLVGMAPPSNPQSQAPLKDVPAAKTNPDEQTNPSEQAKKDDKSQLKALLNEIIISEKCPFEKQLLADDAKTEKLQTASVSTPTDLNRQPSTVPPATLHQVDSWLGFTNPAMPLAQAAPRKSDSISQSSNITSIYIPPPVMGQHQQQLVYNQPLSAAQQAAVNSSIASVAPALDATRQGSVTSQRGTEVECSKNQPDKAMNSFVQASQSLFPSQPLGILPRALAAQITDDTMGRFPQQGLSGQAAETLGRDLPAVRPPLSSHQQLPPLSFSQHSPPPPALQETPMTVLERAPKILLSPATLSTASEELIKSLGAHGTIATLQPNPETAPAAESVDTKQEKNSVIEHTQQLQESTTNKPVDETCPRSEALQNSPEASSVASIADCNVAHLQAAAPLGTTTHAHHPLSVLPISATPTTQSQNDGQAQHTEISSPVVTTATELVATHAPVIPAMTGDVAALINATAPASAPVQPTSEGSELMQMSKMPLSQLVTTSNALRQSLDSQPEASLPTVQPTSLISQQPSAQMPPALRELAVPKDKCENISLPAQVPEAVLCTEAGGLKPLSHQQSYSAANSPPEKTLKSSPEKAKQLKVETVSKPDESEGDKIMQQMHKKATGDKRPVQQQLRTSPGPVASFGYPTTPPTSTTSPVKPTVFSSASSTLAQAQSIMVKTAAMSRTSGIMKAAEQTSRPVRSRTPPRASLSTLPPNTCNNESLGSASALLSSIAKSAWTVTTAMASAAKAKVVPTPKAPEKNLTRMRRSPETLPPAGKMAASDRDRGSSGHDSNQPSRTPPALTTAKHTVKATTELSTEAVQHADKSLEGSLPLKSSVPRQPSHLASLEVKEQRVSAAVTASSATDVQAQLLPGVPFSKTDSVPPQPLAYSLISSAAPAISSAPHTFPPITKPQPVMGVESTPPVRDSSEDKITSLLRSAQQALHPMLLSADTHSDVQHHPKTFQAVPLMDDTKPKYLEKAVQRHDQKSPTEHDSNLVSYSKSPPVTDKDKAVPKVTSDLIPMPRSNSVGEASEKPVETPPLNPIKDQDHHDKVQMKSANQHSELTVIKSSKEMESTVSPSIPQTSPSTPELLGGPVPTLPPGTTSTKKAELLQPSLPNPHKRLYTGELDEPPAKQVKDSFTHLSLPACERQQLPQQERETAEKPSALIGLDAAEEDTMEDTIGYKEDTMQTVHPTTPNLAAKVSEVTGQLGRSEDQQEVVLPVDTKLMLREAARVPEVAGTLDPAAPSERIPENVIECTPLSSVLQDSSESFKESVTLRTDSSPEPSLLNKPDQITNLVEEAIQRDPDKDSMFEKRSPHSVVSESSRHLSGQGNLELQSAKSGDLSKKAEMEVKSLEPGKDGGIRTGKDTEGELEPRRTRHTSEDVPGMSTRSLRSGRRSPAEPASRGKEKEKDESPPTTRGRGQKEKEIHVGGESEAEALSRKRSTRSSGRDMYYGPIPSYKRRKTNQK